MVNGGSVSTRRKYVGLGAYPPAFAPWLYAQSFKQQLMCSFLYGASCNCALIHEKCKETPGCDNAKMQQFPSTTLWMFPLISYDSITTITVTGTLELPSLYVRLNFFISESDFEVFDQRIALKACDHLQGESSSDYHHCEEQFIAAMKKSTR